jgi:hypothetical protein
MNGDAESSLPKRRCSSSLHVRNEHAQQWERDQRVVEAVGFKTRHCP